ncbi:hypothetical protein MMC21_002544 [Puttea exsequens]|nr:hypothetical protein [Puttea exsequens]
MSSSSWQFPKDVGATPAHPTAAGRQSSNMPGAYQEETTRSEEVPPQSQTTQNNSNGSPRQGSNAAPKSRTHWPPRMCRICLETINPTFHPPTASVPGIFQPQPSVTYESSDPEAGRLLRPCKCKGSSKYVHEGCLQAWRHSDVGYSRRTYWQCPTCGFRYRLERMQWSRWISSTATQISLTVFIFFMALFLMGFVADPIINLYVDPYSFITTAPLSKLGERMEPILSDHDVPTWTEHFIKGLASLGLLGFVKVLFALSPWQWWNLRSTGVIGGGGRSGNTGRDRLANISWVVVLIGIGTFLWAVYKGVRAWSRRTLEKAGERVMDVGGDDNDGEEDS